MSSALERFQSEHGQDWSTTVQSPAYISAFTICNVEKLQAIAVLTDDDIEKFGKIILADLRGHLKYETALISLHEKKTFVFQDIGPETYPDPATEAAEEAAAAEEAERERQDQAAPPFRTPAAKKLPVKRQPRKVRTPVKKRGNP